MNQECERRRHSRYQASLEIVVQELSPPGRPDPPSVSIHSTKHQQWRPMCAVGSGGHVASLFKVRSPRGWLCGCDSNPCVRSMDAKKEQGKFVTGVAFLLQW